MARTFESEHVVDLITQACQSRGAEQDTQTEPWYPQGVRPWVELKPDFETVINTYIQETINPPAE